MEDCNMTKLVSILIPCYNAEKWLGETLDCCLRQTYKNIEVIFVDDGSTDNSLAIAREYEKKDNRIHVFAQPNSGGCRARNVVFEHSTGDYIMYLDATDLDVSQTPTNLRQYFIFNRRVFW